MLNNPLPSWMRDRLNQTLMATTLIAAGCLYFIVGLDLHW